MVSLDEHGYASLLDQGGARYANRQEAPPVFDMTGVAFVSRPDFIMRAENLFAGRVKAVRIPEERAFDIDSELDFELADYLASKALCH
jgi:N-acylneuraminate cytidylyltransferase